jgi:hypothetical protein
LAAITTVRTWHRRLSWIVGLQLLLWTVSGLIFTWEPIEVIHGDPSIAPPAKAGMPLLAGLVSAERAVAAAPDVDPAGLALVHRRNTWVWELRPADVRSPTLVDATTGAVLDPINADEAEAIARARFLFEYETTTVSAVVEAQGEFKGALPAWRVDFDNHGNHTFYVDGITGQITKVRSDVWRRFDFFWMLHIMDYNERTDFNTPWLKIMASLGVLTSFTGLWLGVLVFRKRRSTRNSESVAGAA